MQSIRNALVRLADMFAYPLRHSHFLELVNPLWTKHVLMARVEGVWDETSDTRTLTLRPGRDWRSHRAGQFVRLGVAIEGKRHTRTYSISSAPARDDGCITVTVKAITGGVSQHLARQVKVGAYLPLGEPLGEFVLPDSMPVHPLFITGGSGITPVMSILRSYVMEYEIMPDVTHMHYAPHAWDVIFGNELKAMDAQQPHYHLHVFYTRDAQEADTHVHFSAAQLEATCPDWREREVWACGPASLLDAVEAHWAQAGLSHMLHIERFRAKITVVPEVGSEGTVLFAGSQVEAPSDGQTSLLRIAEAAGLNPPHGCRMGICHTCNTTLVKGCVRDLRNGAVISEPGDIVQVCVCSAVGDVELAL